MAEKVPDQYFADSILGDIKVPERAQRFGVVPDKIKRLYGVSVELTERAKNTGLDLYREASSSLTVMTPERERELMVRAREVESMLADASLVKDIFWQELKREFDIKTDVVALGPGWEVIGYDHDARERRSRFNGILIGI